MRSARDDFWSDAIAIESSRMMIKNQIFKFVKLPGASRKSEFRSGAGGKKSKVLVCYCERPSRPRNRMI
jgi:hypothetical protein